MFTCSYSEYVFFRALPIEAHFTYMYKTLFEQLRVSFPFTKFECDILTLMDVAPTQLHSNSRAFLKAFQIMCEDLGMVATATKLCVRTSVASSYLTLASTHPQTFYRPILRQGGLGKTWRISATPQT